MNLYGLTLSFLFVLLLFIFYLKGSLRKKVSQRTWIERLESIARENQILWSTHLPYFQSHRIADELLELEKKQKQERVKVELSNNEGWHSDSDILKYPSVRKLFRRLMPLIESYAQMLGLDSKYLTITAWANVSRNQDSDFQHTDDEALFSGCYYLKGDFKKGFESKGISFFKKNEEKNLLATFKPEPGDFLLFPSDMLYNMHANKEVNDRVFIAFNVHFGNKKKSWLISSMNQTENLQKLDPFYELSGKKNAPHYADLENQRSSMLFHTSKIKRKFIK